MWSSQMENRFISLYQAELVLWNPFLWAYKDRASREEAWIRISEKMGLPVQELKRMKKILHIRFFNHLRRNQKRSQRGEKFEIYNPDWFITEPSNSFFGSLYQLKMGCKKATIKYPVNNVSAIKNHDSQQEKSADLKQKDSSENHVTKYLSPLEKLQMMNVEPVMFSSEEVLFESTQNEEKHQSNKSVNKDGSLNLTSSDHSSSQSSQSIASLNSAAETRIEMSVLNKPFKIDTPITKDDSLKPLNLTLRNHSSFQPNPSVPSLYRTATTNIEMPVPKNPFKTDTPITIDGSFKPLNLTSSNHSSPQPSQSISSVYGAATTNARTVLKKPFKTTSDHCDLYTALLATKLRKLPIKDRLRLMYKIDDLLIGGNVAQENYSFNPSSYVQSVLNSSTFSILPR